VVALDRAGDSPPRKRLRPLERRDRPTKKLAQRGRSWPKAYLPTIVGSGVQALPRFALSAHRRPKPRAFVTISSAIAHICDEGAARGGPLCALRCQPSGWK
jgi:hypothetical protein